MQGSDPIGLDEDMPPAYTPSADTHLGETTLEVGPQRPFQQTRVESSRPAHTPSHSTSHSHSGPISSWSHFQSQSQQHTQSLSLSQPPPQHSSSWTTLAPSTRPDSWSTYASPRHQRRKVGLVGTLINTVRDVVDGVAGAHEEQISSQPQIHSNYYAAPRAPQSSSFSSPLRQVIPDDGSPTSTPAPGHPLLNNGQILVYPSRDHICYKCQNTGFKNYDPSHPCKKCWEKYGMPFTGALTYTPWSSSSGSHASKLQRPLPTFTPPQASHSRLSLEHPTGYALGRTSHSSSFDPLDPALHQQQYRDRSLYVCNPIIGIGEYPPVPHSIGVPPGDARLGGRLCWKCGGSGTLPFLLFDVQPCTMCDGIGRILQ